MLWLWQKIQKDTDNAKKKYYLLWFNNISKMEDVEISIFGSSKFKILTFRSITSKTPVGPY